MISETLSFDGARLARELYEGDSHRAVLFRYGMLGTGAPGLAVSLTVMIGLTLALSALALHLLRRGTGTRT